MPSPFPGMDPYLESPHIFPNLHYGLIVMLQAEMQARLPAPYFATAGTRVWFEYAERSMFPDLGIHARNGGVVNGQSSGGVATATLTEPVVVRVPLNEVREPYLDIYRRDAGDQLVTSVEVLSPTNKSPGTHGREPYLLKQSELLARKVHLVEIDLLRNGQHTTAVPLEFAQRRAGPYSYHVSVRRWDLFGDFLVYPVQLQQRLPVVAIPLLPQDGAVGIDLQVVFDRAYDLGPYRRQVRYEGPVPPPPLSPEQLAWTRTVLAETGLLPDSEKGQP